MQVGIAGYIYLENNPQYPWSEVRNWIKGWWRWWATFLRFQMAVRNVILPRMLRFHTLQSDRRHFPLCVVKFNSLEIRKCGFEGDRHEQFQWVTRPIIAHPHSSSLLRRREKVVQRSRPIIVVVISSTFVITIILSPFFWFGVRRRSRGAKNIQTFNYRVQRNLKARLVVLLRG